MISEEEEVIAIVKRLKELNLLGVMRFFLLAHEPLFTVSSTVVTALLPLISIFGDWHVQFFTNPVNYRRLLEAIEWAESNTQPSE
jgi:hypothetical protein